MSARILNQTALLRAARRLRPRGPADRDHQRQLRPAARWPRALPRTGPPAGRRPGGVAHSDASVRKFKGPTRPILPQRIRAEMLAAIRWVDYVTVFGENTPLKLLKQIKPDVHVKGGSWLPERIAAEKKMVESWRRLKLFPMVGHIRRRGSLRSSPPADEIAIPQFDYSRIRPIRWPPGRTAPGQSTCSGPTRRYAPRHPFTAGSWTHLPKPC